MDIAQCSELPVKIVFLPAADIAAYVADGKVDLGITGQDIIAEYGSPVDTLEVSNLPNFLYMLHCALETWLW